MLFGNYTSTECAQRLSENGIITVATLSLNVYFTSPRKSSLRADAMNTYQGPQEYEEHDR